MNYLALCQETVREAGIAGSLTTVVGQTGMLGKVVKWVDEAWNTIQLDRPNWLFMQEEFLFNTVVSQRDYTAAGAGISDLRYWDTSSFLMFETALDANDQGDLKFMEFRKWYGNYRNQMDVRDNARPQIITKLANNSVRFEPVPDKVYTVEGLYRRSSQVFSANADVPTNLPDDLHRIISWNAVILFANDQNAPDLLDKADDALQPLWNRLLIEQLPAFDADFKPLA